MTAFPFAMTCPTLVSVADRYTAVRARTERLCQPLAVEDYVVTAMPDASPAKWHLAHTTWFFETFVLSRFVEGYVAHDPDFAFLFNSYYVQAGERHCRAQRGLVTRPTVAEVYEYRHAIDEAMRRLLDKNGDDAALVSVVTLGLQHEQQHQELLLTDVKYLFYANPIHPAYDAQPIVGAYPMIEKKHRGDIDWLHVDAGIAQFGYAGDDFAFDNEGPRHTRYLQGVLIADRLVTNAEYQRFIDDRGYERAELWLSAGWAVAHAQGWHAPLYWERNTAGAAVSFTLAGMRPLDPDAPVCHVSYYEADAYARWLASTTTLGARLLTEFEWEHAAPSPPPHEMGTLAAPADPQGWYGAVWQWTQSPYVGYPGYRPVAGALGEYNGKFMADQWVLRGSSIATPPGHTRRTYRNFFPADARWQFTGIRIATDPT